MQETDTEVVIYQVPDAESEGEHGLLLLQRSV